DQEKAMLRSMHQVLQGVEWRGDNIHNAVYECAKNSGMPTKAAFQALYMIFIVKKQGPRLGYFLSSLDKAFVLDRIAAFAQ
ncbi:MAG: lysine--tRNA ligase, partial [Euryarchaeota archaeon]|nr:lysine--tRNA ligase [Euryarchaeota archaeon]